MTQHARQNYFENDIHSATPQRLRLMLIDGAIRFAMTAVNAWDDDREAASAALARCRNIVLELISGVRADRESCQQIVEGIRREQPLSEKEAESEIDALEAICRNVLGIYLVVFRDLNEVQLTQDKKKIASVLQVLEVERETAQMLCQQMPDAPEVIAEPKEEISSGDAAEVLQRKSETAPLVPTAVATPTYGDMHVANQPISSFEA